MRLNNAELYIDARRLMKLPRPNMPMFCSRHHREQHRTLPGAGRRYRRDDVTLYGVKGVRLGM